MGNCCGGGESRSPGAFQGTGHRLGAANEVSTNVSNGPGGKKYQDDVPKPRSDPNLSDEDRARQRAERIAAAEARQSKNKVTVSMAKKSKSDTPLTGPNSKPLMRWTAG
eukprot:scaffold3736_cov103-Cylindrotheca_fusiformis.AAC.6